MPAKAKAAATEEGGWLRFLLPLLDLGLLLAGAVCTLGAVAIAVSLPARSAVLIKAASSGALLPCLTPQGRASRGAGDAPLCAKAHDIRSFHPGQAR